MRLSLPKSFKGRSGSPNPFIVCFVLRVNLSPYLGCKAPFKIYQCPLSMPSVVTLVLLGLPPETPDISPSRGTWTFCARGPFPASRDAWCPVAGAGDLRLCYLALFLGLDACPHRVAQRSYFFCKYYLFSCKLTTSNSL